MRSFHVEVCLDPDAVLTALANHKVACARLCRDNAAVGASVDIQLSQSGNVRGEPHVGGLVSNRVRVGGRAEIDDASTRVPFLVLKHA